MCCCGKGIVQTVAHGAVGLSKVALHIDIAADETIAIRRDVCRWCEFASKSKNPKFDSTNGLTNFSMCSKCHCLIVAKSKLKSEKCPEGKW